MFHRFSTWWRALSVVLLSLATVTWPSAAQAGTTASFSLVHQAPVAALTSSGRARFAITVELASRDDHAQVQVSLFPRLVTRSQIAPLISGAGDPSASSSTTGNFTLTCTAHRTATFNVALFTSAPGRGASPCVSHPPRLRLPCHGASCDGVYPINLSITSHGVTTTEWSMLAVRVSQVARPLRVDWVASLDPTSVHHAKRAIAVLTALSHFGATPLTLTADYRTLNQALSDPSTQGAKWRGAFTKALVSPLHRVDAAPPGNIDYGGLVASGLTTQVAEQFTLTGQLLTALNGRYVDAPVILCGSPSLSSLDALEGAGVSEMVVNDNALVTPPSTTLNWGAPFHVQGARSVIALASDNALGQLVADQSIEPGRRVALTLGTLAFLHYEEPNAPAVRTVVIIASVASTAAAFVTGLLHGLSHNPYVTASSLVPSFDSSLVATNGAPDHRVLASGAASSWSAHNVSSLTSLVGSVNSYAEAVASKNEVNDLRVAVAQSEITGNPNPRQSTIANATNVLDAQLSRFSVDAGAITLAGPGTSLPITILSRATYTVTAVVHLITDRLSFPKGRDIAVTLDSPTKSIRVPTANHRGSSLTLQVAVTTPDGQLTLARAAIQVRIAGTSVVGYLLTLGSLLVLGFWWWRTHRRTSKGRHAQ